MPKRILLGEGRAIFEFDYGCDYFRLVGLSKDRGRGLKPFACVSGLELKRIRLYAEIVPERRKKK